MPNRVEWRTKDEGDFALVTVDDATNQVIRVWPASIQFLTSFLNDMDELALSVGDSVSVSESDPERWGALIMSRSEEGDVLWVDPQRYWANVGFWYRERGTDPHPFRTSS